MSTTAQVQMSQGAADVFLQSAKTGKSNFRHQHVKYKPYAMEHVSAAPVSSAQTNQTGIVFPVPKAADFLTNSFIRMKVPALTPTYSATATTASYKWLETDLSSATGGYAPYDLPYETVAGLTSAKPGWWAAYTNELAHVVVKDLRFKVSGGHVFSLSSEGLSVLEEIYGAQGVKQMDFIGKYVSDDVRIAVSSVLHYLYMKIPAWYSLHPSQALVLSAMPLNPITYEIDTRPIADCIEVSNDNIDPQVGGSSISESAITFKIVHVYASVTQTERLKYTSAAQQDDIMSEWQQLTWSIGAGSASTLQKLSFQGPVGGIIIFGRLNDNKNGKDFFNFTSSGPELEAKGYNASNTAIDLPSIPINADQHNMTQLLSGYVNPDYIAANIATEANTWSLYPTSTASTGVRYQPERVMNARPDLFTTIQIKINGVSKLDSNQDAHFFRSVTYMQQGLNPPKKPIYCYPTSVNMFAARAVGSTNFSRVDEVMLECDIAPETVNGSDYFGPMELFVLARQFNVANYDGGSFTKSMG